MNDPSDIVLKTSTTSSTHDTKEGQAAVGDDFELANDALSVSCYPMRNLTVIITP